jgi:drug/metabolite transporter (DMT)-like permease
VLGLLVGFVGVGALVGFEVGGGDLSAVLALVIVALGYAVGPIVLARWLADLPSLGVIAVSLTVSALVYLPFGVAQAPSTMPSTRVVAAVVALAVLCTALAFLLFFALIAEVGAARAVVITYVNPAVALLLGVLLLDERFTVATAVGFSLILVGCVLATGRSAQAAPATVAAVGEPLSRPPERRGRVGS